MSRTFGTLIFEGTKWVMELEPHAAMFAKRLFPKVSPTAGRIELTNTPSVCVDIDWFTKRFPLECSDLRTLQDGAAAHVDRIASLNQIVDPNYQPRKFRLSLPAREYQSRAAELWLESGGLLCADDVGLGKQQPVDSLVLTPRGYVKIGTLHVGDSVIGSNGKPTRVTGVFPQGCKPSYRVRFTDGTSVEAGPEHLWAAEYRVGGRHLKRILLTTEQVRGKPKIRTDKSHVLSLSLTPLFAPILSEPVEFDRAEPLPIPPYTLGQLIARGSLAHRTISVCVGTKDFAHVKAQIEAEGVQIGAVNVYGSAARFGVLGVAPAAKALGLRVLSGNKRVPQRYLHANVSDRIALLHGLMDGGGTISKERSRVTFSTTSPGLAADVQSLVELLGGVSKIRQYDRSRDEKGIEFQVRIRLPRQISPCRLPRKLARYSPRLKVNPTRRFHAVEFVRDVESVCIAVDAPDHLYVTEHGILTHNTCTSIAGLTDPRTLPACIVCLAHLPNQWNRELDKFAPALSSHVIQRRENYPLPRFMGRTPDVLIISYHKLDDWAQVLKAYCKSIIFDEVQELRHKGTNKYEAARVVAWSCKFRLGLSATPIYNFGGEIWNIMNILTPDALGSQEEFWQEWCTNYDEEVNGQRGRKARVTDPVALGSWMREQHLMIRRTRRDVGRELPAIQRITHEIDCDQSKLKEIEGRAGELAKLILSEVVQARGVKMHAAEEFNVLLRQYTGIAKAPYVAEFVRMLLENGEPVVLFGWHRSVYEIWLEKLKDFRPVLYTGTETGNQKSEAVQKFRDGGTDLLIVSLRSGAGLDGLQHRCSTVVFGELDWSPGVHEQCIGRVYRDGQPHPVAAYFLLSESGIDPFIAETLGLKSDQIDGLRGDIGDELESTDSRESLRRLAETYLGRSR